MLSLFVNYHYFVERVLTIDRFFIRFAPIFLILSVCSLHLAGYYLQTKAPAGLVWLIWLGITLVDTTFACMCGRAIQRLHHITTFDILTELRSRSYFYKKLPLELEKARKKKTDLSLIIVDIDGFKSINDTYGHLAGDEVLKQIAGIFKAHIGKADIAARLGGEEFGILLPKTSEDKAAVLAEKIRQDIEIAKFQYDGGFCHATISAGVASAGEGETIDSFVRLADIALYKAKETKNRVISL